MPLILPNTQPRSLSSTPAWPALLPMPKPPVRLPITLFKVKLLLFDPLFYQQTFAILLEQTCCYLICLPMAQTKFTYQILNKSCGNVSGNRRTCCGVATTVKSSNCTIGVSTGYRTSKPLIIELQESAITSSFLPCKFQLFDHFIAPCCLTKLRRLSS